MHTASNPETRLSRSIVIIVGCSCNLSIIMMFITLNHFLCLHINTERSLLMNTRDNVQNIENNKLVSESSDTHYHREGTQVGVAKNN